MTRIAFNSAPLPADTDLAINGEEVANDTGTFSVRLDKDAPVAGNGDWLSFDSFKNYSRKDNHNGGDEQFIKSASGSLAIAEGRGTAPVLPAQKIPMATWSGK